MRWPQHLALGALFLVASSITAAAQPPRSFSHEPPEHCTSLSVFGGVSTADSDAGGLFGGSFGWQVSPWIGIEGNATWLDRAGSETGFSGAVNTHMNLMTDHRALPFVTAGFGLYHASFDSADTAAPKFYLDRFTSTANAAPRQKFTDPAFVTGGGVNLFVSQNLAVRPQAEAMFVFRDGQTHLVPVFSVHVAYHFSDHPITSSRK